VKDEPISGNYFPAVQRAFLLDNNGNDQFTLIGTHAHGCGSSSNGHIELMLHRRCLADDGYGVGEVLDDTTHITSNIWLILDYNEENTFLHRRLALLHEHPPVPMFGQPIASISAWTSVYPSQTSEVTQSLPLNVHLLSLNSLTETNNTILRLQHIFELGEHPVYSQPVSVDLDTIFTAFAVGSPVEASLSANQPLSNIHRLVWSINEPSEPATQPKQEAPVIDSRDDVVVLTARALRTWTVPNE
jgi:hypothetical protein